MKKEILKELIAKPGKEHHVSDFNPSFTTDMSKPVSYTHLTLPTILRV